MQPICILDSTTTNLIFSRHSVACRALGFVWLKHDEIPVRWRFQGWYWVFAVRESKSQTFDYTYLQKFYIPMTKFENQTVLVLRLLKYIITVNCYLSKTLFPTTCICTTNPLLVKLLVYITFLNDWNHLFPGLGTSSRRCLCSLMPPLVISTWGKRGWITRIRPEFTAEKRARAR